MTVLVAWRAIAVVVLAAASVRSTPDVSTYCAETSALDGFHCASCLQLVECGAAGNVGDPTICPYPKVCDETDETAANCVTMEKASLCQCSSDQCDSYNSAYMDKCNSKGIYDVIDCPVEREMCGSLVCETVAPICEIDDKPGWDVPYPDCTKAYYCREDGSNILFECEANEYVDNNGDCQPAPPSPCASGCTGLCPNIEDCNRYYYCDGGIPTQNMSCPAGEFFDETATSIPLCSTDESVCDRLIHCDFGGSSILDTMSPTTTAGTPSCSAEPPPCSADTVGNTAAAGACCQSYWSCHNYGDGNYQFVSKDCPDGYIFNTDPAYPYCALPVNVDTCDN